MSAGEILVAIVLVGLSYVAGSIPFGIVVAAADRRARSRGRWAAAGPAAPTPCGRWVASGRCWW